MYSTIPLLTGMHFNPALCCQKQCCNNTLVPMPINRSAFISIGILGRSLVRLNDTCVFIFNKYCQVISAKGYNTAHFHQEQESIIFFKSPQVLGVQLFLMNVNSQLFKFAFSWLPVNFSIFLCICDHLNLLLYDFPLADILTTIFFLSV